MIRDPEAYTVNRDLLMLRKYGSKEMAGQQSFFNYTMKGKYTTDGFLNARALFAGIKTPDDLARLMKITPAELFRLVRYPRYEVFQSVNSRGKTRTLFQPQPRLKKAQARLNYFLQAAYYFIRPACVYGFTGTPMDSPDKRNIITNALNHTGKNYVINADIFRFFPSINGRMVRNVFLAEPFHFDINLASAAALLCLCRNWLPTGSPASPVISNLVCLNLDKELMQLAERHAYTFTRYADDLTFSGDQKPGDDFMRELESIMAQNGFQLNYKKYRIQSKHRRQSVTGLTVNEKVNMPREYVRRLRAIRHNTARNGILPEARRYLRDDQLTQYKLEKFANSVAGKENFLKAVRNTHT